MRDRYATAARSMTEAGKGSCGCAPSMTTDQTGQEVFGASLYAADEAEGADKLRRVGLARVRCSDRGR